MSTQSERTSAAPARFGLGPIRRLLAQLGEPGERFSSVLIAGTNGKGSTAAMLASMARAAGYRTGLFHSPALGTERDQVELDGRPVDEGPFAREAERVKGADEPSSDFERLTATAFAVFAEERVDLAVIEAGMGGAHDCTNALRMPLASAVTSVGLDHTEHLGSTLAAIAAEKAGVFRPDRPAILGWMEPEAEAAAAKVARETGARPILAREHVCRMETRHDARPQHQRLRLETRRETYEASMGLAGAHQARNAALAVLLAEALHEQGFERLDQRAICLGLERCRWPGRLEWLSGPSEKAVLLDSAHNGAGAEALAHYLESRRLRPVDLLFGAFRDKDARGMLATLAPFVGTVWPTSTGHPRSFSAAELDALSADLFDGPREPVATLGEALARALDRCSLPLVVTGSVDLVGQVRRRLLRSGYVPLGTTETLPCPRPPRTRSPT